MKTFILSFITALMLPLLTVAQEQNEVPKYGINFSGFVKNDFFYDTRENVTIREGHFLLYPKEISLDAEGKDINAKSSFNFLSIQSRLTGKITAPDAFGAKTSGILEADFFGNESAGLVDANGFRLRLAVIKLNWANTELLTGQFWHPFFVTGCFSGVISFNTGAPVQPFSRNPQLRLTHKFGKFSLAGAILTQRDFTCPLGSGSLRYSPIPDLNTVLSYESKNEESKVEVLSGLGVNYKMLQPLLTSSKDGNTYITNEYVSGFSATAFFKVKTESVTYKMQGVIGRNLFDLTMLGGYVVDSYTDTVKNAVSYSTVNNLAYWTEIQTNGQKVQFGVWAGYTQNLGSDNSILEYSNKVGGTDITVRGANIKSLYRVSPRVVFIQGKLNIATELEYTSVAYATKDTMDVLNRDIYGVITDSENVANIRLLLSFIYNF